MMRFLTAASMATASLTALPAEATTITSGTRGIAIADYDVIGQTFTATGNSLQSFGFQLATGFASEVNGPVTLTIREGDTVDGQFLASATVTPPIAASRAFFWQDFTFDNVRLETGKMYAALLSSGSARLLLTYGPTLPEEYPAPGTGPDAYANGTLIASEPLDDYCADNPCDANFRFTATNVAAIPEPASWALMLAGFAMVGGGMRYRRRAVRFAA